ncbi:hypothetical protein PYV61_25675, partial [Roseisolibacter sp. H3M3-2]
MAAAPAAAARSPDFSATKGFDMISPGQLALSADRWTPFVQTLVFIGADLSGVGAKLQVRLVADTPGAPLIGLELVGAANVQGLRLLYAGTDTIANHMAAGRLSEALPGSAPSDPLALSQLQIRI